MAERDTCIIFLTHVWDEVLGRRFDRLRRESAPHADCWLVLQNDDERVVEQWKAHLAKTGAQQALFTFNSFTLPTDLGIRYFGAERVLANTHFPLLLFAQVHPHYAYYWQIESDVEYRGNWGDFFPAYRESDASLIAAHFHRWQDWPEWFWWPSFTGPPGVHPRTDDLYKAFMAVARFSLSALECVAGAHREGWMGHFEVLIPTSLLRHGHRLEDLNVRKSSYIGFYQDPVGLLPLLSTVRCRPFISLKELAQRGDGAPLLFHPVKERWLYEDGKVVVFTK